MGLLIAIVGAVVICCVWLCVTALILYTLWMSVRYGRWRLAKREARLLLLQKNVLGVMDALVVSALSEDREPFDVCSRYSEMDYRSLHKEMDIPFPIMYDPDLPLSGQVEEEQ